MKLWIDDVRPAPKGYNWARSVNDAKFQIEWSEFFKDYPNAGPQIIDIDHDAGDFAYDGGDYIQLLNWLEETGRNYPIRIHSMNPVGIQNMRRIIERNGWTEVK